MSESVEQINQDLETLKEEALELGLEFRDNIGYATLKKRVEDKLAEITAKQEANKLAKAEKAKVKKVKIILENRDGDSNQVDQFFGFNGKNILVKFGEEVEVDEDMYDFIKSIGGYVQVKKTVLDQDGIPQNKFTKKWKSRFMVERI